MGVWVPHSEELLANQLYGVLKHVVSYVTSDVGEGSCLVLNCKCVEDRHCIHVRDHKGVEGYVLTEPGPLCPVPVGGIGSTIIESLSDVVFCSVGDIT